MHDSHERTGIDIGQRMNTIYICVCLQDQNISPFLAFKMSTTDVRHNVGKFLSQFDLLLLLLWNYKREKEKEREKERKREREQERVYSTCYNKFL